MANSLANLIPSAGFRHSFPTKKNARKANYWKVNCTKTCSANATGFRTWNAKVFASAFAMASATPFAVESRTLALLTFAIDSTGSWTAGTDASRAQVSWIVSVAAKSVGAKTVNGLLGLFPRALDLALLWKETTRKNLGIAATDPLHRAIRVLWETRTESRSETSPLCCDLSHKIAARKKLNSTLNSKPAMAHVFPLEQQQTGRLGMLVG